MEFNPDETAIVEALCQGLKRREILSALRLTNNLYKSRVRCAMERADSATVYELVSKFTAWRLKG